MSKSRILKGTEGFEELATRVGLTPMEREARRASLERSYMPFQCTEHYMELIASLDEPYRTQVLNIVLPPPGLAPYQGRFDPYGNTTVGRDESPFLQHKYDTTLLVHFVDVCVSSCQFCYKVNEIRHEGWSAGQTHLKVAAALEYLDGHPQVNNVLFTGGDPAAVGSKVLVRSIRRLLQHPNVRVVRFATKTLAFDPLRFMDPELLDFFEEVQQMRGKQVVMINQFNHPAELSGASGEVLEALRRRGVQMRGQPAVVKGVNDDVDTLVDLQQRFLDHGVVSYYLTTFMPVRGVEQYGLTLDEVFLRVAAAKRRLSGLEKKGVLLASHDFGKFEIVGFAPRPEAPERIILKWHQAAMTKYLPQALLDRVPTRPEDVMILDYHPGTYCIDHLFRDNGLPHFDSGNQLHLASPLETVVPMPTPARVRAG